MVFSGDITGAEPALSGALVQHAATSLPGSMELPVAAVATLNLARGTLGAAIPALAPAAGHPLFREVYALALVHADRRTEAEAVIGPWDQQSDLPLDYLWLTRMAFRAALWSEIAPPAVARVARDQLVGYEDRVAIAGTGIAIAGFVGHWTGLLHRACGDHDRAIHALTTAQRRNARAGFAQFAALGEQELARTRDQSNV